MILTVTPNPALDLTWRVDTLATGQTHRAPTGASRAGGKGTNVARVLHQTANAVLAISTAGGTTGEEFANDLNASALPNQLIEVAGDTRRSVTIVESSSGQATVINEIGATVSPTECRQFWDRVNQMGADAKVVAISGSFPPGMADSHLTTSLEHFAQLGVTTIVDTSGPAILTAARARATVLKPNVDELRECTGKAQLVDGLSVLLDAGAQFVVVSMGADGMIVASQSNPGQFLRGRLPSALSGNPTGAGDAAVAALAAGIANDESVLSTGLEGLVGLLRRAIAWSAAAVLMPLAGEISPQYLELEKLVVTEIEERGASWR